jgi:hypothetical protein
VEHPIEDMEPAFARPDAYVALSAAHKEEAAKANDDLCRIDDPSGEPSRHFVRAVLPIQVEDREVPFRWGLWVELSREAFSVVVSRWRDPEQHQQPPFECTIANHIPSFPETLGLPGLLQLIGPTTRPSILFASELDHPLAVDFRSGVSEQRALEWSHLLTRPGRLSTSDGS